MDAEMPFELLIIIALLCIAGYFWNIFYKKKMKNREWEKAVREDERAKVFAEQVRHVGDEEAIRKKYEKARDMIKGRAELRREKLEKEIRADERKDAIAWFEWQDQEKERKNAEWNKMNADLYKEYGVKNWDELVDKIAEQKRK
jgi:hypothetical protein